MIQAISYRPPTSRDSGRSVGHGWLARPRRQAYSALFPPPSQRRQKRWATEDSASASASGASSCLLQLLPCLPSLFLFPLVLFSLVLLCPLSPCPPAFRRFARTCFAELLSARCRSRHRPAAHEPFRGARAGSRCPMRQSRASGRCRSPPRGKAPPEKDVCRRSAQRGGKNADRPKLAAPTCFSLVTSPPLAGSAEGQTRIGRQSRPCRLDGRDKPPHRLSPHSGPPPTVREPALWPA